MRTATTVLLVLLACIGSGFCSTSEGVVVAGVVRHAALYNSTLSPVQNMLLNTADFGARATEASRAGVQLLVLPEFGLWANAGSASRSAILPWCEPIPDVPQNQTQSGELGLINPCTAPEVEFSASPVLKQLSCIARNSWLFLASHHFEVQNCTRAEHPDCPSDGRFLWNTVVTFDPDGNLIAKYHKTNPFWTEPFDKPGKPQVVTFHAFGATFGVFVCFDILHSEPAQSLINLGVRHFVYSAAIPQWASNTLFSVWSKGRHSALIASNLGEAPALSGIFVTGQNTAQPVPESKILVSKIPIPLD